MMKFITILSLAVVALAGIQTANAATFDFIDEAIGNEGSYSPLTMVEVGITLNATGQYTSDGGTSWINKYAYLDDHWSGHGDAGLGVCQTNTNSCGSDDNVTYGEKLRLDFGQQVTVSEITMANGVHEALFTGDFKLNIDGAGWVAYNLADTITQLFTGQVFELWNHNNINDSADAKKEFYISTMTVSAVPIPAAIWLFGSAMLGFVGIRRNNKKSA